MHYSLAEIQYSVFCQRQTLQKPRRGSQSRVAVSLCGYMWMCVYVVKMKLYFKVYFMCSVVYLWRCLITASKKKSVSLQSGSQNLSESICVDGVQLNVRNRMMFCILDKYSDKQAALGYISYCLVRIQITGCDSLNILPSLSSERLSKRCAPSVVWYEIMRTCKLIYIIVV